MGSLTDYTDVTMLNESATLVQYDGQMYVKKILDTGAADIYKKLIGKRCNNVSEVLEIYEYKDRTIIIEEYINGTTLQKMLAVSGKIDENQVKDIIVQICDGLDFLHRLGIVHRDINPNNIIITRDGVVKIIDFDISRFVKEDAVADTKILGTVGYAAPEQFGFRQSDKRVDIYAVGVLANVMLTGSMPNVELYCGALEAVIKKATQIDADMRFQTIKEFKTSFLNPQFVKESERKMQPEKREKIWPWIVLGILFIISYTISDYLPCGLLGAACILAAVLKYNNVRKIGRYVIMTTILIISGEELNFGLYSFLGGIGALYIVIRCIEVFKERKNEEQ